MQLAAGRRPRLERAGAMSVSPEFVAYLEDQFEPFGAISIRRMFGGGGVFHQDVMIGLIAGEILYLKVDDRNRPDFEVQDLAGDQADHHVPMKDAAATDRKSTV